MLVISKPGIMPPNILALFSVHHCITWLQTQLIPTTCQIRYRSHCGIIVALDSSEP